MQDIVTTYTREDTTTFIIDSSNDCSRLGELPLEDYERLFVVIDKNVAELYQDKIIQALKKSGKEIYVHSVEPVEYSKSIGYYPRLIEFLEEHTAGRYDAVIAVGGGIVIDLVSFSVSTYMRGLPFYIIATTLIGQTDASTAGKTCLNSENTKNLLGTFYYPAVVYNSIEIMKTCPRRITRQGLSEAFKYSLLTDGELLDTIIAFQEDTGYDVTLMEKIVRKTIESRIAIRKVDPLASNLGHTFGHALEKYYDYKILHGDAILTGTVMAIHYAVEKGLMDEPEMNTILSMMKQAKLNVAISDNLDVHKLVQYMRKDKKSSAAKLHLVMINGIGRPYRGNTPFYEAEYDDVEAFLQRYVKEYSCKVSDYVGYLNKEEL